MNHRRVGRTGLAALVATAVFSASTGSSMQLPARSRSAAEATVFIRVIGSLRAEIDSTWNESLEQREVELGTGSGFVFTPFGHVLTNHHVVNDDSFELSVGRERAVVQLTVDRVEVVFPNRLGGPARFAASIDALDPELDLAILSIAGADLPYLALGDSEAARAGDNVQVFGYPFGREVEIGKARLPDIIPQVSVTRGSVSATRTDDAGNAAFLQTNATVNPGNSGGPMVDPEGYVLGVIRSKLRDGDGIGFAIPVNRVKDFLEFNGYSQLLGIERLRLGPPAPLEGKGVTLSLPDTMEDRSPARLRAFNEPGEGIAFMLDRVASPFSLVELEQALLGGGTFGNFRAGGERPPSELLANGRMLLGSASGIDAVTNEPAKLEFAILERDQEKLLVRYQGPADAVAYNRSVLIRSLMSLEVQSFLEEAIASPIAVRDDRWIERKLISPRAPSILLPEDWESELGAPFPCPGLPPIDSGVAASPAGDFTFSLRVGFRSQTLDSPSSARACSPRAGHAGPTSYLSTREWLGVRYWVEGLFLETDRLDGGGSLQLEMVVPTDKEPFVRNLFEDWARRNR